MYGFNLDLTRYAKLPFVLVPVVPLLFYLGI
jgi:hypothetical protein